VSVNCVWGESEAWASYAIDRHHISRIMSLMHSVTNLSFQLHNFIQHRNKIEIQLQNKYR